MAPKAAAKTAVLPKSVPLVPALVVDNRYLPAKEQQLFRQVLQFYETKDWKKGLKAAESILKGFPEHGETLAMKGILISNDPARKAETQDLIKQGLRNDLKSHIIWHVYGIVERSAKNYEAAYKCYLQAHRIEKDSTNILNDLAHLAVHLRNYTANAEFRVSILKLAPRVRRNWIGLGVAQHLAGQFFEADKTLTRYEEMIRSVPDGEYDYGEIILYHAAVLEDWGEYERCLDFLGEHSGSIVDRSAFTTQRGRLLLKLGRTESAEWAWSLLLEENPDSYEYIKACVTAKGADYNSTTSEGKAAAIKVLDALAAAHPRSLAIRRLALEIVSGEEFRQKASTYLTTALAKGIPSLFADIKSLFVDPEKCQIVGELVQAFRESLQVDGKFGVAVEGDSEDTTESSAVYLWTLYFLASHHSALAANSQALSLIEIALAHTPSLPELWTLKARILKRGGDVVGALEAMSEARDLDGQDRFLNSKHAKYMLRADKVQEAEACVGLFTKKDAASPLDDLLEMQCLWFIQEEGDSFARQSKHALALKRYHQIAAIFDEIEDDQFDFHSYCLRKSTLRAYVELLRYEDTLRLHPRYLSAAKGAISIYLQIHDDPSVIIPAATNGDAVPAVVKLEPISAPVEVKVAAKDKGKKSAKKAAAEAEAVVPPVVVIDQDPLGEKLAQTQDPLAEALKFLRPLEKVASNRITTWLLSFEVAIRRKKYLQALQALHRAHAIDPTSTPLHALIVRFAVLVTSLTDLPEAVTATLQSSLAELTGSLSLEAFNSTILQKQADDSRSILAAAAGLWEIRGTADKSQIEQLVLQLIRPEVSISLLSSTGGLELLQKIGSSRVDELKQGAAVKYPLATLFRAAPAASTANGHIAKLEIVED